MSRLSHVPRPISIALAPLVALLFVTAAWWALQPASVDASANAARLAQGGTPIHPSRIVTDTVLTADHSPYHVTDTLSVESGATLTIEPGVRLEFAERMALLVREGSSLIVNGSESNRVEFTSDKPEKSRGDWPGISILEGGHADLNGLTIRYAGEGGGNPAVESDGEGITLDDVLIEECLGVGVQLNRVGAVLHRLRIDGAGKEGVGIRTDPQLQLAIQLTNSEINDTAAEAVKVSGPPNIAWTLADNKAGGNLVNGIVVGSGRIDFPTTWPAGDLPLVVPNPITAKQPLTLNANTVVKFLEPGRLSADEAALQVLGTEGAPVIFTSIMDDDACTKPGEDFCDTNNDSDLTRPIPGSWAGISYYRGVAGGSMQYASIKYSRGPALQIQVPNVSISHVTIENTLRNAVEIEDVSTSITDSTISGSHNPSSPTSPARGILVRTGDRTPIQVTLTGNTFLDNDYAVYLENPNIELINSGNETPGFTNGMNGYFVNQGSLYSSATWRAGDLPFILGGRLVVRETAATLTFEPGLTVKMENDGDLDIEGGLLVVGTESGGAKVLITALADDACSAEVLSGCDTNGNRDQDSPVKGSWKAITVRPGSKGAEFYDAVLKYGGNTSAGAMLDLRNQGTVTRSEFAFSNKSGLRVYQVDKTTIDDNYFHDNEMSGIVLESQTNQSSVITLRDNRIENNSRYAIDMDANIELIVEGNNTVADNGYNGIVVRGDSTRTHTWRHAPGIPYLVLSEVRVSSSSTLTIEPGAVIKFGGDRFGNNQPEASSIYVHSGATLIARGTEADPIVFTSVKDDRVIDSNPGEGNLSPSAGDWKGIELDSTSHSSADIDSVLSHVEILYAGAGGNPAVQIEHSQVKVSNATIRDGGGYGVRIDHADASVTDTTIERMTKSCIELETITRAMDPIIQRNTLTSCDAAIVMDANVQPDLEDNTATDNSINGIVVSGSMSVNRTWEAGDLPFVIDKNLTIRNGNDLAIESGTLVKAALETTITLEGRLLIPKPGTGTERVTMTSLRDDTCGAATGTCDTNNDGGSTPPRPGDWNGISVRNISAVRLVADNLWLSYAGGRLAAIDVNRDGSTTLENSRIEYSLTEGVRLDGTGVKAVIRANTFHGNVGNGIQLNSGTGGTIEGNVFTGNGRSIDHRGTEPISMRNNVAIGNAEDPILYCANVRFEQRWERDIPREISCNFEVQNGSTLRLDPGLMLMVADKQRISVVGAALEAEGVVFTSASDDPQPGSWYGIDYAANNNGGFVRHSWLMFGGRDSDGMIEVGGSRPVDVSNNLFYQIQQYAISASEAVPIILKGNLFRGFNRPNSAAIRTSDKNTTPLIAYNRFTNAPIGIETLRSSQPVIQFNNFEGSVTGVKNGDQSLCVIATQNWWGDTAGPVDRSAERDACGLEDSNRDGHGAAVSDDVNYLSHLTTAPPVAPLVDGPRCGFTNNGQTSVTGSTSPEATVEVYDGLAQQPDQAIATSVALPSGRFEIPLNLAPGPHRLHVVARNGDLQSPGSGFRLIDVVTTSESPADSIGIRFEYESSSGSIVSQPLRDVAGCSIACGGPSSGRVTLPTDTDVRLHVPVAGSPGTVEFVQPGQAPRPMTYDGSSRTYATQYFRPSQGTFSVRIDGNDDTVCMGFIYLGGLGVVFEDVGVPGDPLRLSDGRYFDFDFEDPTDAQGWSKSEPWSITEETANSPTHAWSDSPGGDYQHDLRDIELRAPGPIDLRQISAPELVFFHKHQFSRGDYGRLQIRRGEAGAWTTIEEFKDDNGGWRPAKFVLDDYAREPGIWIRWIIKSDNSNQADGWHIDDVVIKPGGALNGRYDPGEPVVPNADVRLERQNLDTGAWLPWQGDPLGPPNPLRTDDAGRYGFYYLEPGIYRIIVNNRGAGVYASPATTVFDGTFVENAPIVRSIPAYMPMVLRRGRL